MVFGGGVVGCGGGVVVCGGGVVVCGGGVVVCELYVCLWSRVGWCADLWTARMDSAPDSAHRSEKRMKEKAP